MIKLLLKIMPLITLLASLMCSPRIFANITMIAAGNNHTCSLNHAGAVHCWGRNNLSQLGNGTTSSITPVAVTGLTSGVVDIKAGGNFTCALTNDATVQCWGENSFGQIGNGSTAIAISTPTTVTGLNGVIAISAGSNHTCALTISEAVKCWGYNSSGQLGNGSTTISRTPVDVTGLSTGVTAISVGNDHACALSNTGAIMCWGNNGPGSGQLGDGTTTDRLTPVTATGLASGVTAISAGGAHTCTLTITGVMQCWGGNPFGQLGNGKTNGSSPTPPATVIGLSSGVVSIAARDYRTCALNNFGAMSCWGYNAYGQLGNSTTTSSSTPVAVDGLSSGVTSISLGFLHSCAVTNTGTAKCWGQNTYGQLGNGNTTNSSIPVDVIEAAVTPTATAVPLPQWSTVLLGIILLISLSFFSKASRQR